MFLGTIFNIINIEKMHDLEIQVRDRSTSFKNWVF